LQQIIRMLLYDPGAERCSSAQLSAIKMQFLRCTGVHVRTGCGDREHVADRHSRHPLPG
jgi:hypothetical protein